jgi:O-acetyl-ADP-ribose deacetylase (regulator of RNase III)
MSLPLWEECAWFVDTEENSEYDESLFYEEEDFATANNGDLPEPAIMQSTEGTEDAEPTENQFIDEQLEVLDIESSFSEDAKPADKADKHIAEIIETIIAHCEGITRQTFSSTKSHSSEITAVINSIISYCEDKHHDLLPNENEGTNNDFDDQDLQCEEVWTEELIDIPIEIEQESDPTPVYAFPINKFINKRIYLYLGEIYKLPCDAIVVGNVESLTDRSEGNEAIFTLAGIELEPALAVLAPCTTGDSCVTSGFQMPCEWIIHSVGPRYDPRFLNAAEHALFSAYKSALVLAVEKNVQRLVLGTVYQRSKHYPRFEAAHVALRTVRKFLDHSVGDEFEGVMFCVNNQEDFEIYSTLMRAYFPRNQTELDEQAALLPLNLGDEWGELVIESRVVRLDGGPKPLTEEERRLYMQSGDSREYLDSDDTASVQGQGQVPKKSGKIL